MKLFYGSLIAALVMSPFLASGSGIDPKYLAFGMGVTKCVEANENFEKEEFQFVLKVWLTGYMTAVNSVLKEHPIGLSNSDIEGSIEAIKSFCALPSNKLGTIAEATESFWRGRIQEMSASVAK